MAPHAEGDVEVKGVTDTTAVVVPDPISLKGESRPVFSIDDVLPHRQQSKPVSTVVAAFADAHMFKSPSCEKKPKSKRWDHRLSTESVSRSASSLKGAMKYFRKDTISLCGGLPSPDYFPFEQVDVKLPIPPQFSQAETVVSGQTFSATKHDVRDKGSLLDLTILLNYGQSMGPGPMVRFLTEHTEIVHDPPYSDWDISMTAGSTSALDMSLRMFVERGDYVITEEYTFSTAIETVAPIGGKMLGIKMDADGMLPDELDHVLSTWDEKARRARKPFVVYTVPTGQNPTASTQSLERRKAIYAVAEKHDLFILEDEPYYFLQMEPFVSGVTHEVPSPFKPAPIKEFLSKIAPSYLSIDTSGRVLRLDSFSKIIAPGSRCGWVTGPAQIVERFIRHNEVSAQTPSGFSTIALYKLLEENWGHKGFLEWLMYIRAEYTRRRDVIVNACERYLPGSVASWEPPKAGMFHWIKVDATKHPQYDAANFDYSKIIEMEHNVFLAVVEKGVLIAKGSWFRAQRGSDRELFFRTTFAASEEGKMVEAIRRFGEALRAEFGLEENGHAK